MIYCVMTDSFLKKYECRPEVYAQLSKDFSLNINNHCMYIHVYVIWSAFNLILSDKLMYTLKSLNFPLTIPLFTGYMYIVHY